MNSFVDNQYDKHWGPFTAGALMAAVRSMLALLRAAEVDRQRPDRGSVKG